MTSTIGFIGAGIMGAPMINNLVGAGYTVRSIGRSAESRRRAEQAGAVPASDARELAASADVVITMLPDSPDVREVVLGSTDGLIEHLSGDTVYVDMSTISPAVSREISSALSAAGVSSLDAPVSGGEAAAIEGTLSIMVGGSETTLDAVRPVLESLGTTITHVGPAGSGQATKAANQLVVALNLQAVAEAIVYLEAHGVDLERALDALGGGLAGSTVLTRKRGAFTSGSFTPGFRLALHDKDLGIVQETARSRGLALPATSLVAQLVTSLVASGHGGLDHSALLLLARSLNGSATGDSRTLV